MFAGPNWAPIRPSKPDQHRLAQALFNLFGNATRVYALGTYRVDRDNDTWKFIGSRLLRNSFELGFVILDDDQIGVLWVGDED